MRLVLDTNIIISALFWGGTPRKVLEYAKIQGTLCFTDETFRELEIVLGYSKFRPFLQEVPISIPRFLDQLTVHAIMLTNVPPITFIKEDPSDNKFLACALATSAEYIISGDAHLLTLKSFQGIPILTPRGFLKSVSFLK